jgi:hypothetical protein
MVIELDEEQRAVLGELVRSRLSNLSSEIRHTDSPPVRQELRDEREVLRELTVVLAASEEAVG